MNAPSTNPHAMHVHAEANAVLQGHDPENDRGARVSSTPVAAELEKLKHAPIWIAYIALPLLAAAIGTFNYQNNLEMLTPGWENLWTQHTLFSFVFFLPALIGVGSSWLMRIEHTGGNWNQLAAQPVAAWRIALGKVVVGMAMLAIGLVATGAYFVMAGKAIGIDGMPGPEYLGYLACTWVGGGAVVAVQLVLSLVIRNFALPVGIALAGGITGLLVKFKVKAFAIAFPYSLPQIASNSTGGGGLAGAELAAFFVSCIAFAAIAIVAFSLVVERNDVKAGS